MTSQLVPEGIRNNNPGNIDWSRGTMWVGQVHPQPEGQRFCIFTTPIYGLRALLKLLIHYHEVEGCETVKDFISRWAPPAENNTNAYVLDVVEYVNNGRTFDFQKEDPWSADTPLDLRTHDLFWLAKAIIHHENGQMPYTEADFQAADDLLGVEFS